MRKSGELLRLLAPPESARYGLRRHTQEIGCGSIIYCRSFFSFPYITAKRPENEKENPL